MFFNRKNSVCEGMGGGGRLSTETEELSRSFFNVTMEDPSRSYFFNTVTEKQQVFSPSVKDRPTDRNRQPTLLESSD